nr:L,D-transpeptidase [Pseudenhygromyxa sp. WMMC2535]
MSSAARGGLRLGAWLVSFALASACHHDGSRSRSAGDTGDEPSRAPERERPAADAQPTDAQPADTQAQSEAPRRPYKPPSTLGAPIEHRLAKRTRLVYAEPSTDAARRGRIPARETFAVYATSEGPDCRARWAQVADAGWACLDRTEPSEQAPRALPELAEDALLPFIYVRHRDHEREGTPALPVYRSLRQYNAGEAPVDERPAYGSYAFVRTKYNRGAPVLVDDRRRVVPAEGLEEFEPSEFSGRDLVAAPVPAGLTLAWAVRWKTEIRERPDPDAPAVGRVRYHDTVYLRAADGQAQADAEWFEVAPDHGSPAGWLSAEDIRRLLPQGPDTEAPILAGQLLLDIDLDQQVLTIWREDQPIFATLISSGRAGDRTPLGLYRVETKWAYGKMASLPSADDPYYVEAVPWTMYFDGRYALHASYWHNLFGHRASHGCINLSPRDARRVFELATPALPPGWLIVHEHAADPGALVRVRRGDRPVPDRRPPL